MQPFTLLIKPTGSDCNLDCKYCFYKDRALEVGSGRQRMSEEVLEKLIKDYLQLGFEYSGFSWQGGEPTLMGLEFFKRAVELQRKYAGGGQTIANALQTNAVLLDDDWCRFLHENNFLVGISIDGPKEYHDHYRKDHGGAGTFDKVMEAIENCKKHKVEFNTLILLSSRNVEHADELFDFFVKNEIRYVQLIPCVEIDLQTGGVADFSITPEQYGKFMCRFFERWYDDGARAMSIRDFDSILAFYMTGGHTLCTYNRRCSQYIVVEHSGDCFPCDFFVEPKWLLGSILKTPIEKIAASEKKLDFSRAKQKISDKCLVCRHLAICRGGCLKDRFLYGANAFDRPSYFCEGYRQLFDRAGPKFMQLAAALQTETGPRR